MEPARDESGEDFLTAHQRGAGLGWGRISTQLSFGPPAPAQREARPVDHAAVRVADGDRGIDGIEPGESISGIVGAFAGEDRDEW
jgi:hypothetical protein